MAHGQPVAPRDSVVRIFGTDLGKLEATIDAIALGYSLAAETAALRGKPENFERISAALGSFRDAVAASDPRAAQLADGEFHHAIIESAEQPMLHDIIRDLDAKISLGAPLHIWGSIEQHEPMQRRALEDHIAIFEAIRSRDRQAAFDLSYDHAKIDLDIILELLQLQ
ncbi:FCD domain-containing protein [Brevibacterium linens]|uniref:FCD domain-containing protein n=1 Tax=Brevibacterium linens TaxID=1703 RepID=UPI0006898383|nr:FCD domain-containing protein [Brevibacterium linens]